MWFPWTITVAPTVEPVTLAQAKDQCIIGIETDFDVKLGLLIKAAREHVEEMCNVRFAEQTIEMECDCFEDLCRLPTGPIKTLVDIAYVDGAGASQTVPDTVYDLHKNGIEPSVTLKYGQAWPIARYGSRIKLTGVFGGACPEKVHHAMLLLIGHWFAVREAASIGDTVAKVPHGVDDLLSNHRRGA